ncbi:hypothetical protein [Haloarchaeobius sp. HME9146]|uniref:DUF7262 family protein n=1 Tax=Haloarchaeobius sp. HME9146 TaxID=2978732 RepID=UPI0021C2469A|nr:hypothetical protein [Haloarchaeobius sp. HME9146]MCT9095694.1 hypothetical protein [Haloarchaeobius sp. HME9146]
MREVGHRQRDQRAQLSLPAVEAGIGVLLVLGVVTMFALPLADADTRQAQLDAYAGDTASVLSGEPPRHDGTTRLAEVAASPDSFDREKAALDRRVDRILPENLLYRVETPHGAVGYRPPAGTPVGVATVPTGNGDVTIRVWYV